MSRWSPAHLNHVAAHSRPLHHRHCSAAAPGVEFHLQDAQPPHLFVIRKQFRSSDGSAVALAYYYILDGTIYQAPTLHAALAARMVRPSSPSFFFR